MKQLIIYLLKGTALALMVALAFPACKQGTEPATTEAAPKTCPRIVSLDGAITEVLFELDRGSCIVGVDVTSTWPEGALAAIPALGHVSRLNAEAILQLKPDLILAIETEKENAVLRQLQGAGIACLFLPKPYAPEAPLKMAEAISARLGGQEELAAMKSKLENDRRALQSKLSQIQSKPRVLFIYARGKGNLMVAGQNTAAESIIALAGGQNAMTDFEDFRALSAEGLMQSQPDAILMFSSGLSSLDGIDGLLGIPGVAQTPAGKRRNIIVMEGNYLMNFGPRCLQAALELATKLHANESI